MKLREFVATALREIAGAVHDAQSAEGDDTIGHDLVGRSPLGPLEGQVADEDGNMVGLVRFDLATTVEESGTAAAGASIKVLSLFDAKAGGERRGTETAVSRIQFAVPLATKIPFNQSEDRRKRAVAETALIHRQG